MPKRSCWVIHQFKDGARKVADEPKIDNIWRVERTSMALLQRLSGMLSYGKSVVSGLVFHSKFADIAVENVGLQALIKDENLSKELKEISSRKV